MTPAEAGFLQRHLDRARHYLEFGAGVSTGLASRTRGIESIDTVESSRDFIEGPLLEEPGVREALSAGRLKIHQVDIGPTGAWGGPVDPSTRSRWPDYSSRIFGEVADWDLVLVDGRFRVACALAVLLRGPAHATVLVHDFWCRPEYFVLLPFFDVKDREENFVALRRKSNPNLARAQGLYEKYSRLPFDLTWSRRIINRLRALFFNQAN